MKRHSAQQVQDATTREQCADILTAAGFAVYDSEDHASLAEALAEHMNTEGLTLEDL